MQRQIGADGMATEEYNFNSEVPVENQVKKNNSVYVLMYTDYTAMYVQYNAFCSIQDLLWKEKYRPRKPRFLNRVHTVR